ncbi:Dynein light chain 1, cytoplasmic [Capsicum baccatum]|uniref:Dynein light chain 1, cytoplasmic n=1 Tax=Capsicum baccatum TaxID=33114 RepID=A0A2G2X267_CAPBA|nr:Dynein light chain 1, cytoplasmic [Capsicum baccatum]
MATRTVGEKQNKGSMYVYNLDTGNPKSKPKPESDISIMLKKGISKGWPLRRSKTYRENHHQGESKNNNNNNNVVVMSTARKSVSSIEGVVVVNNVKEEIEISKNNNPIVEYSRKSASCIESSTRKSVTNVELNVASMAAILQVKVLVTDMPGFMQVHAFKCARNTYDSLEKFSSKHMAYNMKKEFDKVYGPAWHCIVGSSFGSYVTHSTGIIGAAVRP